MKTMGRTPPSVARWASTRSRVLRCAGSVTQRMVTPVEGSRVRTQPRWRGTCRSMPMAVAWGPASGSMVGGRQAP